MPVVEKGNYHLIISITSCFLPVQLIFGALISACKAGYFINGTTCSACAVDTYTNTTGHHTSCKNCEYGYNNTKGATECGKRIRYVYCMCSVFDF